MNFDRLGISAAQQAAIDAEVLSTTINMLNQCAYYPDMAWRVADSSLADQLESVHNRTFDVAHEAIIKDDVIQPVVLQNLGRLAFIDTLWLPSSAKAERGMSELERGRHDWKKNRRLFVGLVNDERLAAHI